MDFVLIHGSYHGAWCWDLVVPELERRGHRVAAADLPVSDPHATAPAYADAVIRAADGMYRPVVVAHSMAGLIAPLVAEQRPVSRLVFLAAMLPIPGVSINEQRGTEPIDGLEPPSVAEWTDLGDDLWMVGPTTARELFFHDAPEDVAAWAVERLRPQCYKVMAEPSPLRTWPSVDRSYIVCRDDRAVNPEWGRSAARDRLGVVPVEIDGSHSPFLTRPIELVDLLLSIAG